MLSSNLESALASALLESLWQDTLLALLAAISLRLLIGRSAALRHAVGMIFLIAMLSIPLLTLLTRLSGAGGTTISVILVTFSVGPSAPFLTDASAASPALWLGWLWALGVAAMLSRIFSGIALLRRLDRQLFEPLPSAWQLRVETLRRRLGIRRTVVVKLVNGATPPCTARALRPVIWLPASILTGLGPDQIEAVIAHELAHIRRLDWVWNSLQCVIEALLFYHPAMWWLSRRVREERENACDDLAASACGDPIVLAEALTLLARLRSPHPRFALSTNGSNLMKRMSRLLTPGAPSRPGLKISLGLFGLLALGCSGVVLSIAAAPAAPSDSGQRVELPHWWEQFGDATHVSATVGGQQRVYRRWRDLNGNAHESYAIDGRPASIDADVRQWIAQVMIPPPRPPLPKPPVATKITDNAVFRSAVASLAEDPLLVAQLGNPITVQGTAGPSYIDDYRADLWLRVSGPKGAVRLHRTGIAENGRWRFRSAEIEPL